jgi:hypothetical protein
VTTASLARPGTRRSLLGKLWSAASPRCHRLAVRAAAGLREHMGTLAGLAAIDYGAFTAAPVAGWVVTGCSLLLLEFKVRD